MTQKDEGPLHPSYIDRNAAEGVIPGQTADLLLFPDELLAINNVVDPREVLSTSFHAAIRQGRQIRTSTEALERASSREQDHDSEVVYRLEQLVGDLKGAIEQTNLGLFMLGRQEFEERNFSPRDRKYQTRVLEGLASNTDEQIAALVEVKVRTSDGSNVPGLPPWQSLYPGQIVELEGGRNTSPINIPGKKYVAVATGVAMDVSQSVTAESFPDGVALVITPPTESEEFTEVKPRRGERDFDADPVFTQASWEKALKNLQGDIWGLEANAKLGQFHFGLSDIAYRSTSFMLGFTMVAAREVLRNEGLPGTLLLPFDIHDYKLNDAGDILRISNAVAVTVGGDNLIELIVSQDPHTGTPKISIKK